MDFALSDCIDWAQHQRIFQQQGRTEIADFLAKGQADVLHRHLDARGDWQLVMNAGDKVYELSRANHGALAPDQMAELDRQVFSSARHGFQYRYESIRLPDGGGPRRDDLLADFLAFLSSPHTLGRLSDMIGVPIDFADGQATSYGPGHFLTAHDDDVAGKNRVAAYVFSLTPAWRTEWGGLLMFHGSGGNVDAGYAPRIGALRVFAVPQLHSVSYVTPFAEGARLSITGWLRRSG